ncbi:hypothetical protein ACGFX4_25110 [Kitasatospora sp. NPDC048365]|uniref:hypothetical protein n=1 Tax=Kitasatospora sp. NPDC048365 TaxID=3364050 RepID=UPI003712A33D
MGWILRVRGAAAAVLLALTAVGCSGQGATPAPTVTVTEVLPVEVRVTVTAAPGPSATATASASAAVGYLPDQEAVRIRAGELGVPMPGGGAASYPIGGEVWYLWAAPDGRFCHGTSPPAVVTCDAALPAAGSAGVASVQGPLRNGKGWVTLLAAGGERVATARCGPVVLPVVELPGFAGPGARWALYAVTTDWAVHDLWAEVVRPDGGPAFDGPSGGACRP